MISPHYNGPKGNPPPKSIMNKQITKAPSRIQRFLLRLQKHNFDLEYTKGQWMKVTDTLSRAALQDNTPEISDKEMNYFVHFVMSSLPISEKSCQKLVTVTAKDDILQKLRHQISVGWSEHRLNLDLCLRPYHRHNSEVTYQDRLLLKGHSAFNTPTRNAQNSTPTPPGNWKKQSHRPDNHSSCQTWMLT